MSDDRKVRMARPDACEVQGHTIVGGRPSGHASPGRNVPRAMEALIKKAAVDAAFLEELVTRRSRIAAGCQVALDPAECAMLDTVPESQLRAIVAGVRVPDAQRSILAGAPATAIVALLAQLAFSPAAASGSQTPQHATAATASSSPEGSRGPQPFRLAQSGDRPMPPGGCRPDNPVEIEGTRGIRPDLPPEVVPVTGPTTPPSAPPASPSPADTAARERLSRLTIATELSGKPLKEAIRLLGQEAGMFIRVDTSLKLDWSRPLRISTKGLSFKRALRGLLDDLATHQPRKLAVHANEVVVTIGLPAAAPAQPSATPAVLPSAFEDRPSVQTKGLRPDLPPGMPSPKDGPK